MQKDQYIPQVGDTIEWNGTLFVLNETSEALIGIDAADYSPVSLNYTWYGGSAKFQPEVPQKSN